MTTKHDLGNGWVATMRDDGSMTVSNVGESVELDITRDSMDRLRSIVALAEHGAHFTGIQARDNAIEICGPQTGHAVRAIAFCDNPKTAHLLAHAARTMYDPN